MAKRMAEMSKAQQARRRKQNAAAQAALRARRNAMGLYQCPAYVEQDSRFDMWRLSEAFVNNPDDFYFDRTLGSLRNLSDVFGRPGTVTSPARVNGEPASRQHSKSTKVRRRKTKSEEQ